MPFGRKAQEGAVCVYEYGCLPPVGGLPAMVAQLAKRNRFWNALVEIDRRFRQDGAALLTVPASEVPALENELAAVREAIKQARQAQRNGTVAVSALTQQARGLRAALKVAWAQDKLARRQLVAARKEELAALDAQRLAAVKVAQAASGLWWGNYDDVLSSYNVARLRAMKGGQELRFHRWDGTGKVTVRYQQGMAVADVWQGEDTRLQIDPVDPRAWTSPVRGERRHLARTIVRLRVGSNQEDRTPLWLELPVVVHRPLPAAGVIRGASVCRERIADSWRYKLIVVVADRPAVPTTQTGTISIDIGWRKLADDEAGSLRVAYWRDDEGREGEVRLAADKVGEFRKVHNLQAIRDRHLNQIKVALGNWLRTAAGVEVPVWLQQRTVYLAQWRSAARLAVLVQDWADRRFVGGETIYGVLVAWLTQDRHLWQWQRHLDDQLRRWRREEYRRFAAWVVARYGRVVLEDFDLRKVAEKSVPEEGTQGSTPPDWQRTVAACSVLRLAVENACRREGVAVEERVAAWTTQTCHACGQRERFDAARELVHTCGQCGATWDQDANAAANLPGWQLPQMVGG